MEYAIIMTGSQLKEMRLYLGFTTRREFADRIRVPRRTVEGWEHGRRAVPAWLEVMVQLLDLERRYKAKQGLTQPPRCSGN